MLLFDRWVNLFTLNAQKKKKKNQINFIGFHDFLSFLETIDIWA